MTEQETEPPHSETVEWPRPAECYGPMNAHTRRYASDQMMDSATRV